MLIPIFALLVMVAGMLIYALASNAKVAEIGRIMIICGMLVVVASTATGKAIKLL